RSADESRGDAGRPVDELAGLQDGYERELTNVLESVVAELEKLNADDRRVFRCVCRGDECTRCGRPTRFSALSRVPRRVPDLIRSDREQCLMPSSVRDGRR